MKTFTQVLLSSEEHEANRGAGGQSGEGPHLLCCVPPVFEHSAGGCRRQVGQSWTLESGAFYSTYHMMSYSLLSDLFEGLFKAQQFSFLLVFLHAGW